MARLQAALPEESGDPRIATLKTLAAFTARLDPASEPTLPAQISSYVSNAIAGAESKLRQLLEALSHAAAPGAHLQSQRLPMHAQVRAAERAAAIDHDLKSLVLSVLRDPGAARTPDLTRALNETLVTLTAVQLNALSSADAATGTIAIALPVFFRQNGNAAQLRISRDAGSRARKLEADDFHLAFVLDTANLGTVAIDVQTVGRTVKLEVKTETQAAAGAFERTLDTLRGRLESLRYRVASWKAAVLVRAPAATRSEPKARCSAGVDLRA